MSPEAKWSRAPPRGWAENARPTRTRTDWSGQREVIHMQKSKIAREKKRPNINAILQKRPGSTPFQGLERAIYSSPEKIDRPIRGGGRCGAIVAFSIYDQDEHRSLFDHLVLILNLQNRLGSIMSPSNKNKDTSHPRHRSHKGCWTCKRKRIQCDETRPGCRRCAERGLTCEGYEIRLRWGAGIASRGRFSGADKPIQESIPPPSKRRWDLRGKTEQREGKDEQ